MYIHVCQLDVTVLVNEDIVWLDVTERGREGGREGGRERGMTKGRE